MKTELSRAAFVKSAAATALIGVAPNLAQAADAPMINRIRVATLNSPDMKSVADWYVKWFEYRVTETGKVDAALAQSWGTPKMAGAPFTLLASTGSPDVFLRVIQGSPAPAFNPRGTFGWGSLEFIVADLDGLYKKFKSGGIGIFREPASLGGIFASIHAMQIFGPMNMTHNLSVETGNAATSNLPIAKSTVDRMFLVGLNGPSLKDLSGFYSNVFKMTKGADFEYPNPVLSEAMGLAKDHLFKLGLVRSAQKGNTIELHDLPNGAPRPQLEGELPPGVGMISFGVADLNALKLPYLGASAVRSSAAYKGRRAATLKGPAGELIELIEE